MACFTFQFYPDTEEFSQDIPFSEVKGAAGKAIQKLWPKHKELYLKVKTFFEELGKMESFDVFISSRQIVKLEQGLWEMRIPPVSNSRVFRIYFCVSQYDSNILIIFDAEYKTQTKPKKVSSAKKKMKEYHDKVNKGEMK